MITSSRILHFDSRDVKPYVELQCQRKVSTVGGSKLREGETTNFVVDRSHIEIIDLRYRRKEYMEPILRSQRTSTRNHTRSYPTNEVMDHYFDTNSPSLPCDGWSPFSTLTTPPEWSIITTFLLFRLRYIQRLLPYVSSLKELGRFRIDWRVTRQPTIHSVLRPTRVG